PAGRSTRGPGRLRTLARSWRRARSEPAPRRCPRPPARKPAAAREASPGSSATGSHACYLLLVRRPAPGHAVLFLLKRYPACSGVATGGAGRRGAARGLVFWAWYNAASHTEETIYGHLARGRGPRRLSGAARAGRGRARAPARRAGNDPGIHAGAARPRYRRDPANSAG